MAKFFGHPIRYVSILICEPILSFLLFAIINILLEHTGVLRGFHFTRFCAKSKYTRFIVRWFHRIHRHIQLEPGSQTCTDNKAKLGPGMTRTSYSCTALTEDFKNVWADICSSNRGLETGQVEALARFQNYDFQINNSTSEQPLQLDILFNIFDDYFFLGALRKQVALIEWVDLISVGPGVSGLCSTRPRFFRSSLMVIQIKKEPHRPGNIWTRDLDQRYLEILLHEMLHAFFRAYSCPVEGFLSTLTTVKGEGWCGHGPLWREIALIIKREAGRAFGEHWHDWSLNIDTSHVFANGQVLDLVKKKQLKLTLEDAKTVFGSKFFQGSRESEGERFVETLWQKSEGSSVKCVVEAKGDGLGTVIVMD